MEESTFLNLRKNEQSAFYSWITGERMIFQSFDGGPN